MNMRKPAQPLVEVPKPSEDRPSWVKVGIIAALGFVIGVAWPRLAGVHLGPAAPAEASPAAAPAPSSVPGRAEPPVSSALAATAPSASAPAAPPPSATVAPPGDIPTVTANRGSVLSCKAEDGETKKGVTGCGAVAGFDAIALPRLKKLASCPAALGANGRLSIVFNVDFPSNKVAVEIGKSSTVSNVDGFAACVKPAFQGVSLGALDHQNPKYALFYSVVFAPKDARVAANASATTPSSPSPASTAGTPASTPASAPAPVEGVDDSTAQVIWEVAIVRDTPRTGQVLARLQRGTKIRLGTGQDGWYRVKYGTDFASEGWVYRGAIGR
jgi:hypothetical protein